MAVTFHNFTQTAGPASVGTKTVLHTVSAAEATVLVFTQANTAISISAMAANGISLTRLGHISASSSRAEVWGLERPPVATLSISANVVGAASLDFCIAVVSYTGARQIGGSPFGTVVAGTAQGVANVAFSVSSTSTDLVVYGFGVSGAPAVTITTGTNRGSATATTTSRLVIGDVVGAATVSISATAATANTWAFLGVPIVASAAAITNIKFDNAAYTGTSTVAPNSAGLLITATANATLLVWVNMGGGSETISAINVGSLAMGFLGGVNFRTAAGMRAELWGLTAPPSGVLTISAVMAGGLTTNLAIAAATYTGVKQSGPFGGVVTGSVSNSATASLIISSTAGNVIVLGGAYDGGSGSAGPGTAKRIDGAGSFPGIIIVDTPGINNGTASVASTVLTFWGLIGVNLIQNSQISGAATITDTRDVFSASGQVVVSGFVSATDAADKFSSTSNHVIVSGWLSATDVTDKFSASGRVIVVGRLSATDARDVFSASGFAVVTARLSATDARDTFSASGYAIVSGRLSATDATDKFSASGTAIPVVANISGIAAFTDAHDLLSASGQIIVQGLVNFTDRPDTFSASGTTVQSAAAVVQQDLGAGGGHGKQQREYFRADPAFWSLREQYLKRIHKDLSAEPEVVLTEVPVTVSIAGPASTPIDPGPLLALRASRTRTVEAIPAATNMRQLRYHGARLATLNAKIAEQKRLIAIAEQQAAAVARAARKVKRAHVIRKAKRKVKMLAATQAVAALSYIYSKLQ